MRLEAEQAGAMYVTDEAVCDGRIVTAQTWQSHPQFYREIFARVSGKSILKSTQRDGQAISQ